MSEKISVGLGARSYDIHVGAGLLSNAGALLASHVGRAVPVVTDASVAKLHLDALIASMKSAGIAAQPIVVKPGEATKSFAGLESLCTALLKSGVERGGLIVALGGGVIGDLTGFAAGVLKRGVDFAQIPTTLLAQVDSSVGGKTAINTSEGKNLVGLFHQPRIVIADVGLLATLPPRELRAGYAEVVKYGALGDADFFAWLEAQRRQSSRRRHRGMLTRIVAHSCRMKADIVARDERETGDRALLNLGHTFGHALEAATGYSDRLLHGEGVAIGMALAFRLSAKLGLSPAADADRIERHLRAAGLPAAISDIAGPRPSVDALLAHMAHDKKARDGKLTFVLVHGIGHAFVTNDVPIDAVREMFGGVEFPRFRYSHSSATKDIAMTFPLAIAAIVLLLFISAFFSGSETALTAVSRGRMHQMEKDGSRAAHDVNRLLADREGMIGALLLGNTFVNILVSSLATLMLAATFGPRTVAVTTLLMTFVILVFAEVLPKTLAIARTDRFALAVAYFLRPIVFVLAPVVRCGAVHRVEGAGAGSACRKKANPTPCCRRMKRSAAPSSSTTWKAASSASIAT